MARRALVILTLAVVAGLAGSAADAPNGVAPRLPGPEGLVAGSGWKVDQVYHPVVQRMAYQVSMLSNQSGVQAQLFVGATARPQTLYSWSGELGFLGEGYVTDSSSVIASDIGRITIARMHRGADANLVAYAAVRPDGVFASGGDRPVGLAWDALAHRGASYFVFRVTISAEGTGHPDAGVATQLLKTVLLSAVE